MSTHKQQQGTGGEQTALEALIKAGYEIVERNWQCPLGEIDIVARHKGDVVIVEVRSRNDGIDAALESVGRQKRARLVKLAQAYLEAKELSDVSARIDIVAVSTEHQPHEVDIIEHAVGW